MAKKKTSIRKKSTKRKASAPAVKAKKKALPKPRGRKPSSRPAVSVEFRVAVEKVEQQAFDAAKKSFKTILTSPPEKARAEARATVQRLAIDEINNKITEMDKLQFAFSCSMSDHDLRGYATLDDKHAADINDLISQIEHYVDDDSQKRPLNFLMLASPGAGKSHFINCVAKRLKSRNVTANTFNMASMSGNDELIRPLDEARNAKVEDQNPLLFLDEFDSSPANYGLLLPLLWDGALSLGQRDLKLGKIVIVLAGSGQTLPEALEHAKSMRSEIPLPEGTNPKLIDLFSRINGSVVRIPTFLDPANNIDRRADKVVIGVQLLRRRFGQQLSAVPLALFRLIAHTQFRYDVRSIAHLIDLIPNRKDAESISFNQLSLPVSSIAELRKSSLAYHLVDDENHAHGIVETWKAAAKHKEIMPISAGDFPYRPGVGMPEEFLDFFLAQSLNHIRSIAKPNRRTARRKNS